MDEKKQNIAVLGSTGSIGKQALAIIDTYSDLLQVELLTANNNAEELIQQAIKFKPNTVVIGNKEHYHQLNNALSSHDIKVFAGEDALHQSIENETIDLVLNSLVGFSGFLPTINAVKAGKKIALANKESLVVGGELINELIKSSKSNIIPVDSEHSAIFQCLVGELGNEINKIYLTASGGPFLGYTTEQLKGVTRSQALNHPNWEMGNKITIDSATLMNKGFEVIEAKWLFGLEDDQIEVVIHPQSIIHSFVKFYDGSLKAQLGVPDMIIPIQYAFFYPERKPTNTIDFDFTENTELTFAKPDMKIFRNLALAYECLKTGGNFPCALNAANEIAVSAFLEERISFLQMPEIIEKCLEKIELIEKPSLDDYILTDKLSRELAQKFIK